MPSHKMPRREAPGAPNPWRAMERIARETASSRSLPEVLDAITHSLTEEMGAALARIWLLQPDADCAFCQGEGGPALHLHAGASADGTLLDGDDRFHRLPLVPGDPADPSLADAALSRAPILLPDVPAHPGARALAWAPTEGIRSMAAYPLLYRDRVLGVLAILAPRAIEAADSEALSALAAQAAVAVQSALPAGAGAGRPSDLERQASEIEDRARELAALNSVAQAMARSPRAEDFLDDVLQTVLAVTGADAGRIHLEEDGSLRTVVAFPLPRRADAAAEGPARSVLTGGVPVVMAETDDPEALAWYRATFGAGVQNAVSVPIAARGRALGVMTLACSCPREFTVRDLQMLRAIAQQMGLALDNARLLRAAEERSELMATAIQETHHRVKNNLQAISSLLELTVMQPGDLRAGMRRVNNQVRAIALVHDYLSRDSDLRHVALRPVLESLIPMAVSSHTRTEQEVKVLIDAQEITMPSKEATSLALITSELVANAVEHGLSGRPAGQVSVRLARDARAITLEVRDDGRGIPAGFDPERDGHLGTELVLRLARRHLRGRVEYIRENGTLVRVTLPATGPGSHLGEGI